MTNKLMTATCLFVLSAAPVFAGDMAKDKNDMNVEHGMMWSFGEIDTNQDKKLSREELSAKGADMSKFDKADANKDGELDEAEFVAYTEEQ